MVLQNIPGGPEMVILVLIAAVLPLAFLYALFVLARRFVAGRDRVDELERRLGRLDRRVEELEGEDGPGRPAERRDPDGGD